MDLFDLINWILMLYFLRASGLLDDESAIEFLFMGDAIPGGINGH